MNDHSTIAIPVAAERNNNISHIFKRLQKQLYGFIKQRVSNNEDAEDILQEVFYQFAGNTEPIEQISGWLYKVARNKITDNYRKKRWPLAEDMMGGIETDEGYFNWQEFLPSQNNNPETESLRNLFWDLLKEALDELPETQREVFIQHELEGIPFKEIEAATGVSTATLITRKRYAVLHLRDRLASFKDELLNY